MFVMLTIDQAAAIAATWTPNGGDFVRAAFPTDAHLQAAITGITGIWEPNYAGLGRIVGISREAARTRYARVLRRLRKYSPTPMGTPELVAQA